MTIEPLTGKIIWDLYASPAASPGTYPVTVKVSDSTGHTDYQSFTLTVLD
jgi:Putative Ig domain